jgi:hypothetical protein|tara:strand:- start:190 stop:390 length:201 start_codon:yes stop_codon:yes gene_type:complete
MQLWKDDAVMTAARGMLPQKMVSVGFFDTADFDFDRFLVLLTKMPSIVLLIFNASLEPAAHSECAS